MKLKLPPDPLEELQRQTIRNARAAGRRVEAWYRDHPNEPAPVEVTLMQREARESAMGIERLRLQRNKQLLAERVAAADLPPVDEAAIAAEIDTLVADRLAKITGRELYELARERIAEERQLASGDNAGEPENENENE